MRISDWSSDVCSSDLGTYPRRIQRALDIRVSAADEHELEAGAVRSVPDVEDTQPALRCAPLLADEAQVQVEVGPVRVQRVVDPSEARVSEDRIGQEPERYGSAGEHPPRVWRADRGQR